MSLTAPEIASVLKDLRPPLEGARLGKVSQVAPSFLVLDFRAPAGRLRMRILVEPGLTHLCSITQKPANPPSPFGFQMLLRKEIDGMRLDGLAQVNDDRIVWLAFSGGSGDDRVRRGLVAELTPRPNVFLVDDDDRVLGMAVPDRKRDPGLRAGDPYEPPTKPDRKAAAPNRFADRADEAVRDHYDALTTHVAVKQRRQRLDTLLRKARKKNRRLVQAIEGDLAKATGAQDYRRYGEALKPVLHQVEKGAESVRVPDYAAEGAPEIEVPLKPELSATENMERYFRLHRKYRDAVARIEKRLDDAIRQGDALAALQAQLDDIADEDTTALDELERGLPKKLKGKAGQRGRQRQKPLPPFRTFVSHSGMRILVGRDARRNDALTFRHARGNDLWLHVKDYRGSHIVIALPRGKTADKETLLDAASLAIAHSKAPEGATVEVAYTHVKNLRKPRGAPPGAVTYTSEKTLYVTEDAERLDRLRQTEERPD